MEICDKAEVGQGSNKISLSNGDMKSLHCSGASDVCKFADVHSRQYCYCMTSCIRGHPAFKGLSC